MTILQGELLRLLEGQRQWGMMSALREERVYWPNLPMMLSSKDWRKWNSEMTFWSKWGQMKRENTLKNEQMRSKTSSMTKECVETDGLTMTEDGGKVKRGGSTGLTLTTTTPRGWNTDHTGLALDRVLEESKGTMKTMGGGTGCPSRKADDPQAIDMIRVFRLVQGLGGIRSRRNILVMIGKRLMEVSRELGMMRCLKMLRRNSNFF